MARRAHWVVGGGGARGRMTMATSVALPAVRHPVVLAKSLATLAVLHAGPFIAGIGAGSGRTYYAAVGVPFAERWTRFDEAARILRAVLRGEDRLDVGPDAVFAPRPDPAPQVWVARSWGSGFRLRDIAGTADGWFASGYNTDPARYAASRALLDAELRRAGSRGTTERDPSVEPAGTRKLARTTKLGRLPGGDHQPSCRTAAATSVRGTDGDCRRSGRAPRCAPHGDYHPRRASPLTLLPVEIDQDNTGPEVILAVRRRFERWVGRRVEGARRLAGRVCRSRCSGSGGAAPSVHSWSAVGRPLGASVAGRW